MASHKFRIGQAVEFAPSPRLMPASPRTYTVVRLLPTGTDGCMYRIKCESEPFERVARERELTAIAAA
ncbi:MAG: hypothetical protein AB7O43_01845 [Hyphomicrobiaceae bacterium]